MWAEDNHYLPKKKAFAKNPLLHHSRVGKRRARTDKLPAGSFAYGRPGPTGEPTAGEVIHQWKFHTPNEEAVPSRDYVRTNKKAADFGCTDAKQNSTFRYGRMYRQRKGPFPNKEKESFHAKLSTMTFGVKNKESIPIRRVVTGEFHRKFIDRQKKVLKPKPTVKRVPNEGLPRIFQGVHDRRSPGPGPAELFKMKQFLDVGSRVEVPNPKYRNRGTIVQETPEEMAIAAVPESEAPNDACACAEPQDWRRCLDVTALEAQDQPPEEE